MANYVTNHIYINGSKQAVVEFLNKGLKGNKAKERVSIDMSGEEIVAFVNGLESSLTMGSFFPRPKTFDTYDTTNEIKAFNQWYFDGCVPYFVGDAELREHKQQDIIDYLKAHPEEFQPDENGVFNWIDKGIAMERLQPGANAAYVKYMKGYYQAKYYQKKKYGVVGWYDWNCANYGCKWNCAFGAWKCEKDKDDTLCLSVRMSTPWSPAYRFVENLNKMEGITVYAYAWGDMNWPFFFWFNGRRDEGDAMEPRENENYEQRKKELETIRDQKMAKFGNVWTRFDGDDVLVLFEEDMRSKIGEVESVDVPTVGKVIPQGQVFGSLKGVETDCNLYMPATGEVLEFNAKLKEHPESLLQEPYDCWIIRIRLSDSSARDKLIETQEARIQVQNEWQNAIIDVDDEMLDEKWQQFKKELNEEIGLI